MPDVLVGSPSVLDNALPSSEAVDADTAQLQSSNDLQSVHNFLFADVCFAVQGTTPPVFLA